MKSYTITSKAGRRVAGRRNTGVGTDLEFTEDEAAAAIEAGELLDLVPDNAGTPEKIAQREAQGPDGGKLSPTKKKAPAAKKTGA